VDSFYDGREQTLVKHVILKKYLEVSTHSEEVSKTRK
jgi:hypothetical protein